MKNKPGLLLAFLLVPAPLRAEDFSMFVPTLALPFLLAGFAAALVIGFRIRKVPGEPALGRKLKSWAVNTGVPVLLGALASLLYLKGDSGHSVFLVAAALYAGAFGFAFFQNAAAVRRAARPAEPPGSVKKALVRWLVLLALLAGAFVIWGIRLDRETDRYMAEHKAGVYSTGKASIEGEFPEGDQRYAGLKEAAAEDGRERILDEVKRLGLRPGGAVGDAIAADPAAAARLKEAVRSAAVPAAGFVCYAAGGRTKCSVEMRLERSALRGFGFDLAE